MLNNGVIGLKHRVKTNSSMNKGKEWKMEARCTYVLPQIEVYGIAPCSLMKASLGGGHDSGINPGDDVAEARRFFFRDPWESPDEDFFRE